MKNLRFVSVLVILIMLFILSCTDKEPLSPNTKKLPEIESSEFLKGGNSRGEVTVMDWNIYVGANVDIVLGATSLIDLAMKVAAAYDTLQMTNFPERAVAIAKQVAKTKPHIIGLQEVSLIQRFSTFPPDPASFVEQLDFLNILLNALAAEGLDYQLADSIQDANVYVPMFTGIDPQGNPILHTVRLLDADAILVRGDVEFSNVIKDNYIARLNIPAFGISIPRGYVSIEATVNQKTYRFINTHLEAFSELIRLPQAQELAASFTSETLPIILVGDFNTFDPTPPTPYNDATYQFLTLEAGYEDTWDYNLYGNQGDGFTSPQASGLMNPLPNLYQRIDLIFARNYGGPAGNNEIGPVQAEVIGDELQDRTPSGLWPSDHAGVVAKLHLSSLAF